jgi:hypothetical protein
LLWPTEKPTGPHAADEQMVRVFRTVGSTGYPHDEDWIRALGRRSFEHDLP